MHPRVVELLDVEPSQGAALTVTVANGNQMLCCDVVELDLTFMVEGGDRQVIAHSCLYVLKGL